jgi:hypothetical protein
MRINTGLRILFPALVAVGGAFALYAFAASKDIQAMVATAGAFPHQPSQQWRDYWYGGKAELTSYDVQQARYGQMHAGEAVTVFVTENFSPKELTKADGLPGPAIPVLKCNFDKKFITGIYPYSMLMTVASPVDVGTYPHAMKVSASCQEWCGHTYTQFNLRGSSYAWEEHSYFPGEGDKEGKLMADLTEDELWTRLRIAPDLLPVGKFNVLPSSFYLRLRHQEIQPREAELKLNDLDVSFREYTIRYTDGSRSLSIRFEKAFPYIIQGWTENYEEGFGPGAHPMTTTATRKQTILLDYWSKNAPADTILRKELGM